MADHVCRTLGRFPATVPPILAEDLSPGAPARHRVLRQAPRGGRIPPHPRAPRPQLGMTRVGAAPIAAAPDFCAGAWGDRAGGWRPGARRCRRRRAAPGRPLRGQFSFNRLCSNDPGMGEAGAGQVEKSFGSIRQPHPVRTRSRIAFRTSRRSVARPTPAAPLRQVRADPLPLLIRQIGWMPLRPTLDPGHPPRVLAVHMNSMDHARKARRIPVLKRSVRSLDFLARIGYMTNQMVRNREA